MYEFAIKTKNVTDFHIYKVNKSPSKLQDGGNSHVMWTVIE